MTEMVKAPSNSELPAHLRDESLAGMNDSLKGFVRPPIIKIVQGTAKPPISDMFKRGDAILTPTLTLLAAKGQTFQAVPLMFFPEWIVKNPIGADVTVADRSFDPKSDIAIKSRDPKTRKAPWEQDKTKSVKYLEVLNFVIAIWNNENLPGLVAVVRFSSGEHKTGTSWATSIKMRNIPMCGTIWEFMVGDRSNKDGTWGGFNIHPPKEGPSLVMDSNAFESLKKLALEYQAAHKERLLVVDDDDAGGEDEASTEF